VQSIVQNLGLTVGSLVVELLVNPARFFGSFFFAVTLALACLWTCLRIGRLVNLAYRPGLGNLLLAILAALGVFLGVISLTSVHYARSLVALTMGEGRISETRQLLLDDHLPEVCRAMRDTHRYWDPMAKNNAALDCESPNALQELRADLTSGGNEFRADLQDRLLRNEIATLLCVLGLLVVCLSVAIWRASRSLEIHVGSYRRA
jgi:hypothetical protein